MSSKLITDFYAVDQIYRNHSKKVGYDWILGYDGINATRQKFLLFTTGILFVFSYLQALCDIGDFEAYGDMAITVILCNAASFSLIAAITLVYYRADYKYMLDWCEKLYTQEIDRRLHCVRSTCLKKSAKDTLLFIRLTIYGFIGLLPVLFVSPLIIYLITGVVTLPYPFHIPYLNYRTYHFYAINSVSQFISTFFATVVTSLINCILITILIHAKYQLDFIDGSINVIINQAGKGIELNEIEFMMKTVIDMHADVLNIVKLAGRVNTIPIMSFDLVVYFIIGFTYIVVQLDKSSLYFVGVAIVCVTYLGIISYFGALLYERLTYLSVSIYCTNWYELDVKHQKTLQLMMLRSQNSKPLTVAGCHELSLNSFLDLLRRSYSFCAVVQIMISE